MSAPAPEHFAFRPGEQESLPARLALHADALARLVIAIDGPAGAGKTSTARGVATRLGLRHLDTGALYRALTLAAQRRGLALDDGDAVAALVDAAALRVAFPRAGQRVFLAAEDVTEAVRAETVTAAVSQVSALPAVRAAMLALQRRVAAGGGTVMEGRDIGTVVLPAADLKVFLTAAVATRARRRQAEEAERGAARAQVVVEQEIQARDSADSSRATAPLVRAADAIVVDTTALTLAAQVEAVVALALRCIEERSLQAPRPVVAQDWMQPGYRTFRHGRYWLANRLIRGGGGLLWGLRRQVHPACRVPGSVLVACNHISGLDPPLVGAALPFEVYYVAKRELFAQPIIGRILAAFNAFPILRGTADYDALDRAVALLQSGRNVLMFPEGTRQRPGRLGAPRWGFGYVALRAQRPIVPAFIRGSRDRRPRLLRREPVEVWVGEPFALGALPDTQEGYLAAGRLAMRKIAGLMLRSAATRPLPGLDPAAECAAARVEP